MSTRSIQTRRNPDRILPSQDAQLTSMKESSRTDCDNNHKAMKEDDRKWRASAFGGYQPLDRQLGEIRHCPLCQATVIRFIGFSSALSDVVSHLANPEPTSEIYVHSASLLAWWAVRNIPAKIGVDAVTDAIPSADAVLPLDWQKFGAHLREQRESAGLTRQMLSEISGVADSTIRNFETGRHRPRPGTVLRLRAVAALQLTYQGTSTANDMTARWPLSPAVATL